MDKLTELSVKLFALNEIRKTIEQEIDCIEYEFKRITTIMFSASYPDPKNISNEIANIQGAPILNNKIEQRRKVQGKISQIKSELYILLEL